MKKKPDVKKHKEPEAEVKAKEPLPVVDTSAIMAQMYRGMAVDVDSLSGGDKSELIRRIDEDTERETILTERERARRALKARLV